MTGDMVSIPTTTASMDLKQSEEDFKVAMQTKIVTKVWNRPGIYS